MLKLKQNITPIWTIDGVNKIFTVEDIIWAVQSIYVDGSVITSYSIDWLTITFDVAPTTSVSMNYFYREVSWIEWNWQVTLWDLKLWFYRRIWRVNDNLTVPQNLNKLYPEDYVKSELRKSYKRIVNKSPENDRIQQYTIDSLNGYKITWQNSEDTITLEQSITQSIEWMFLFWEWVSYEYYGIVDNMFQVKDIDISKIGDKVIVGHRIPYGVQKISSVYINWTEIDYIDERSFWVNTKDRYTIIQDFQWNEYLFLPYSEDENIVVVKYISDPKHITDDNDIIDIPEEYMDVIIYDTAYRLLKDKEDERWAYMKEELWNGKKEWLLYEYQSYVKSRVMNSRTKIGLASTYNSRTHYKDNYL